MNCLKRKIEEKEKKTETESAFYEPPLKIQKIKKHKCNQCDYVTDRSYSLKLHKLTHEKKKLFQCDYTNCKYESNSKYYLKIHQYNHTGETPYVCSYLNCNTKFKRKGDLKRHEMSHLLDKPFKCHFSGCAFQCTTNHHLNIHKRRHTNDKPYMCEFKNCDYRCADFSSLKVHKMTHVGDKPFKCNIEGCAFKCVTNYILKEHQKRHSGEKCYLCDECKKCFITKSDLFQHKKTHTGEKPYPCDVCNIKFARQGDLKQHKMIHTGEKPHACLFQFCGYKCRRIRDLKEHQKARHSERGHQRQKKEEEKIDKFLTSQNILFDRELQVDFKCAFGSDRAQTCAKIDFVVQNTSKQTLFLIEVDEDEHITYDQSCETRRMMDCYTSLLMSHLDIKHMVWIRYNPNRFKIDEEKQKVDTKDRQAKLLETIQTYEPTKAMEILYLYYSSRWSETKNDYVPVIFDDPDYNCELKPLCQIIE